MKKNKIRSKGAVRKAMNSETDFWLCTEEAAAWLDKSLRTLENWRYRGAGPDYYTKAGIVVYKSGDLKKWEEAYNRPVKIVR